MDITEKLHLTNEDNMALMARYPDKYFDLAIVDPPYGIGMDMGHRGSSKRGDLNKRKSFHGGDAETPKKEYFDALFKVSKNQIIWGSNYMIEHLYPTNSWVVWNKLQPDNFTMAMGELAWTSFNTPIKIFTKVSRGGFLTNGTIDERIHPTQKPVALYKWLLDKYAKPNDKILDTHLGSMSIAIACHDYGFDLTGAELDPDYYAKGIERVKNHISQQKLF